MHVLLAELNQKMESETSIVSRETAGTSVRRRIEAAKDDVLSLRFCLMIAVENLSDSMRKGHLQTQTKDRT
jgi:hypothetical protein